MASDGIGELVTAADIGRRLDLTPERIRQLARDNLLPEPVGAAGRNTLWLWDTIADWATATGRLGPSDRPATQAWTPRRGKRQRFRRSIDTVIQWGHRSTVHVRVWHPLDAKLRPVVLLGELDENDGKSVTNGIEVAATTTAAQLLGPDGLQADWYEYWPDATSMNHEFHAVTFSVAPVSKMPVMRHRILKEATQRARLLGGDLRNPQWSDISRETLENLVGEVIEVYPSGAYTSENVRRYLDEGPFEMEWDPEALKPDIDAALKLRNHSPDAVGFDTHLLAFLLTDGQDERVKKNEENAAHQHRGLAVELRPYAPSAEEVAILQASLAGKRLEFLSLAQSPDALVAHQEGLRNWLLERGTETDRLLLVPGRSGLAWLDPWEVGVDDEDLEPSSPAARAVRHADQHLTGYLSEHHPNVLRDDYPTAVPSEFLDGTGDWARQYLNTVSWWGPRPDDQLRCRRVAAQLERGSGYAGGYDPWGRLVLRAGKAFVVEWPLGPMLEPPPDEAVVVADHSSKAASPVFIRLPDSRLDLLPAPADRRGGTSFTWGYRGGGPFTFTQALHQLVTHSGRTHSRGWEAVADLVVGCKSSEFKISLGELRSMVGSSSRRPRVAK